MVTSNRTQFLSSCTSSFDTVNHDVLITRPSSWFGVHGSVDWFNSYLSSYRAL